LVFTAFPCCHIDCCAGIPHLRRYEERRWWTGMGSIFPSVCPVFLCSLLLLTTRWLGQNSKQGKLGRQLTDIQIRMRLRATGSRQEIRETYMPMLASKIVSPLVQSGAVSFLTHQTAVELMGRMRSKRSLITWTSTSSVKKIGMPLSSLVSIL
jgi:hypothetical protein